MSRGKSHNRVARRDLMKLEKKSMQRRARQQAQREERGGGGKGPVQ